MKVRILLAILACLSLASSGAGAETRTYYQVKDIAAKENSRVSVSSKQGNLFEYTFAINRDTNTITRTSVRRLDQPVAEKDTTVYRITKKLELLGSPAGNGGKVLLAVREDGGEMLELGHRFAFTARISPFSQVITGIYKRNYQKDRKTFHRKPRKRPEKKYKQ